MSKVLCVLSNEGLRARIAELLNVDSYVIVKRGLFYRPLAGGYTAAVSEAWKLPLVEAKKYEMYSDRADVPACEKVLIKPAPTPDYPNDLNAMFEAEENLHPAKIDEYVEHLGEIVRAHWIEQGKLVEEFSQQCVIYAHAHATARQRALAFVKTMEGK